ncbi:adenylate kinase [candidate division KSB1 bacterium]|nr:adenylate kinase [candidate division KSB1 bacterium]
MRLIFLGAPGTGKGTQGKMLSEKNQWLHISTGDILRAAVNAGTALGKEAKTYMDAGKLVPDDLMNALVRERLSQADCNAGFILDGFPRTIDQAQNLDQFLKPRGTPIDQIISLEVAAALLIQRLTSRRLCRNCGKDFNLITNPPPADNKCPVCQGEIYQRADDHELTVQNRLQVYEKQTAPLKKYYIQQGKLTSIDGNQPIECVQQEIEQSLDRIKK